MTNTTVRTLKELKENLVEDTKQLEEQAKDYALHARLITNEVYDNNIKIKDLDESIERAKDDVDA